MLDNRIKRIVIVGGGSAGWMAAAALIQMLRNSFCQVYLIESEEIGIVGVGEATIPPILSFNRALQLDEDKFIRETNATFKLGIKFKNWSSLGSEYFHPFGRYGAKFDAVHFHQHWLRANALGLTESISEFSIPALAAEHGKFARPDSNPQSLFSDFGYAFHFDAALYARFLRDYAETKGVVRLNKTITNVNLNSDSGFIQSVDFSSGDSLDGDFFIDCSGFKGILIEGALKTGYDDWSHFLPCNRAVAVPSENVSPPSPFTVSTAHKTGWQWRIPLQHRTGNGHVFCDKYCSDDEAISILLKNLEGPALSEPRVIPFTTGVRKKIWNKNCLALGLASGFMEPLESTSIHLVQSSIIRFLSLFPNKNCDSVLVDEFNTQSRLDYEHIRDFIVLHYHATTRSDSQFWDYCRTMEIPNSLEKKIALYRHSGRLFRQNEELFLDTSWFAVLQGQGIFPRDYDSLADAVSDTDLKANMEKLKAYLNSGVKQMPTHEEFLTKYCKANLQVKN